MTSTYQAYTVTLYVVGFDIRQLATLANLRKKTELINYIEDNNGVLDGEWYRFPQLSDIERAIRKTKELGGILYHLPVNAGVYTV